MQRIIVSGFGCTWQVQAKWSGSYLMSDDIIRNVLIIIVLVMFSAYFSATETAFTSVNRIRLKNMAGDGNRKADRVLKLSEKYDKLLTTILVGNNIVNIAMTSIATILFVKIFGSYGATIATVVITVVVLVFGEITPKRHRPRKCLRALRWLRRRFLISLW